MISIRTVGEDEWERWREVRLAALAQAPEAFCSTLAEWTGTGDIEDRWRKRLVDVPYNVLAYVEEEPAGMVSATAPQEGSVELISMWVAPVARGAGVGDALIAGVFTWAEQHWASSVALSVRIANHRAISLYARNGFVDSGITPDPDDKYPERRMVRISPERSTFNYAPIAVGVVFLYAGIFWLVSTRKWFKGPRD